MNLSLYVRKYAYRYRKNHYYKYMKSTIQPQKTLHVRKSWPRAYAAFLLNRNENLVLKLAPIVLMAGSPELLASNIIPVVGEVIDIGGASMTVLVVLRTLSAVKKYR
jgi:hypothetical protein